MSQTPLRYKKLIKELPKHKSAKDALLASGFAPSTADKSSKRVLKSAIKYEAQELMERTQNTEMSSKQMMAELIGLSREDLFMTLLKIATQDKDYGSALKVLTPLARQYGVVLAEDTQKTIVPILNVGIRERNNGLVEPDNHSTSDINTSATLINVDNNGDMEGSGATNEGEQVT